MNLNNAYVVYKYLVNRYTPQRKYLKEMRDAVVELTYALLQDGENLRSQRPEVPKHSRNLSSVFGLDGRRIRSDALGEVCVPVAEPEPDRSDKGWLKREQKNYPWRTHMSYACITKGRCSYEGCPGLTKSAETAVRKRGANTYMRCEECSVEAGGNIFFCNGVSNTRSRNGQITVHNCHELFHRKHYKKQRVVTP